MIIIQTKIKNNKEAVIYLAKVKMLNYKNQITVILYFQTIQN